MKPEDNNELRSVSRLLATLEIEGLGIIACELVRHLAPLTIAKVFRALPISDRVHFHDDKFVYIQTVLKIGPEKQRSIFQRGDIAFLTTTSSICFFTRECATFPMTLIGMIKSDGESLRRIKIGTILTLKQ
jgi:uncharacterized protein